MPKLLSGGPARRVSGLRGCNRQRPLVAAGPGEAASNRPRGEGPIQYHVLLRVKRADTP